MREERIQGGPTTVINSRCLQLPSRILEVSSGHEILGSCACVKSDWLFCLMTCLMQEFLGMLKLKPNERVLDVGCGVGGGDFLMAADHDVFVHGLDLSVNMVLIALERAAQVKRSKVGQSVRGFCSRNVS